MRHISSATIFLSCADSHRFDPCPMSKESMDRTYMLAFLGSLSDTNCDWITNNDRSSPACGDGTQSSAWRGIHCTDMAVTSVRYGHSTAGQFNIQFLPNSVQRIFIAHSGQTYELATRCLPRDLQHLEMPHNRLYGSIDFQGFPEGIQEIDLSYNNFSAHIDLFVTQNLRKLTMSWNPIEQRTMYYDCNPKALQEVNFYHTGVKQFVAIDESRGVMPWVFHYERKKKRRKN